MFMLARDRALIALAGPDRRSFLQGIVSNDVEKATGQRAIYAAFLTPQGKYLHDIFIAALGERLLIDCEAGRRGDLLRRLSIYKLRAKVALAEENGLSVGLHMGIDALAALGLPAEPGRARAEGEGLVYVDPRLPALGARAILPAAGLPPETGTAADYDRLRISLGVPDGSRDLPVEKAILLENGFDELNAIDWDKGCYMGQELTARTRYRGLIRKRLLPVAIEGAAPAPGTPLMQGGKEAGEMRSAAGDLGLALVRLEALGNGPLTAAGARLTPRKPDWMRLPTAS
ncbi:MAG TPA: folate-binding protein [Dongiaceae bacterium]|nr:folate-binding protein [Dongiaceae bacterium]